jgi:flagellar biosynthesis GTPase FlhF
MTDTNNLTPDNLNNNYSQINNLLIDNKNKINTTSELKRSFTESNNLDMNLEEELRDLKKVIETQKKKISQLEKRQTSIIKKGSQLEDAVNDLFDMVEGEHDLYDPDYSPGDDEEEDTLLRFNISAPNLEQFGKSLEENLGKLNSLEGQIPPQRKKRDILSDSPSTNHINQVEIELTPEELRKLRSGGDPAFIKNIIKKTKQKTDPIEYIREYCVGEKWNKARTTRLINQAKEYLTLIGDGDDTMDLDFFIQVTEPKRKDIIKALQDLKNITSVDTPYKFRILSSAMDLYSKKIALYKTDQLLNTEPGTGDYYKLKTWLDTLLDIPWGEHNYINVHDAMVPQFLSNARATMDTVIHGQDETKDIIIQIISKMLTNPGKCGNVFAIYGPPGVGKTTIIKDGMSKALGIPFAFLSLGGATDSSYLDGHGYTYEGSTPGKIVDILRKVRCMNPIFYFDELDKVSETRKGEEVANLLIHLTDPSQNTLFQDKYLGNVNMDISKSIFVFSFNDITKVNPILLDRMELIYVKGFTPEEKLAITRNYILPEMLETYKLYLPTSTEQPPQKTPAVVFTDENLDYVINYENLSVKEQGVRQIKRRLEKICSQLNILKLVKGSWHKSIHSILDKLPEFTKGTLSWPLSLSNETLGTLLKIKSMKEDIPPFGMYC